MRINPAFDITQFSQRLIEFRKRYSEAAQLVKNDILETGGLAEAAQAEINRRLAKEIK